MEFYKKLAAICCLLTVLNGYVTDGLVKQWTSVAVSSVAAYAVVANMDSTLLDAGGAPGTADVSFRDGLTSTDGQIIVTATAALPPIYTLDTTSLNTFAITGGVISVKAGVTLSSSNAPNTMIVTATDVTDSDTGILTLTVTVNAMPTFSSTPPSCLNIADGKPLGEIVYTFTVTDPEGTTVTMAIISGDGSAYFTTPIVSSNLQNAMAMDQAAFASFTLIIAAVDAGSPPSTATTTLTVEVGDVGTATGTCSGGTVVIGSVMTTMALLITYFI